MWLIRNLENKKEAILRKYLRKYLNNSFHAKSKFAHLKLPRNQMIKKYFILFTQGKGTEVTHESIEHTWEQQLM